uniref:Membrane metallo-endopeptidase-like 1 n=1 Tax=Strigamia maritima TaxID=126957 RepID=T1IPN2_STRMM
MWTKYHYFLAVLMVITGSINTLSTAIADGIAAVGIHNVKHTFDHPYVQSCGMFIGEMLCFMAFGCIYYYNKRTGSAASLQPTPKFNPFIFLAPAMCDMIGTSTMYFGLTLTFPSSFQMLRGAVIIFTGLLSVAFLNRTLKKLEWGGIFLIILGLFIVGLADFVSGSNNTTDRNGIITGDLLIVTAQIIAACQMVIEEKFVVKHNVPPLLAVGFEGMFGFIVLSILLIPMYFIHLPGKFATNPEERFEDPIDAFTQMGNSPQLCIAVLGNIFSIAFFNFAGISVTKEMSATTRMVLDSVRTIVIWAASLAFGIGKQQFHYLQVIGFIFLLSGMCLYYDIIIMPFFRARGCCGPTIQTGANVEAISTNNTEANTNDSHKVAGKEKRILLETKFKMRKNSFHSKYFFFVNNVSSYLENKLTEHKVCNSKVCIEAGSNISVIKQNRSKFTTICLICFKLAYEFLTNMDPSADPCVDFYQFACGGFANTTNELEHSSTNKFEAKMVKNMEQLRSKDRRTDDVFTHRILQEKKYREGYFKLMVDLAVLMGADKTRAEREMKVVLDFETKIAEFLVPLEEKRNVTKFYNEFTVNDLQKLISHISWVDFLNSMKFPMTISKYDKVIVTVPSTLKQLSALLEKTNKRIISNYMLWRIVLSHCQLLHKTIQNVCVKFYEKFLGFVPFSTRKHYCINTVFAALRIASGAIFAKKLFDPESKTLATDLVFNVKDVLSQSLSNTKWMDSETLAKAMEKVLRAMKEYIAYPEELLDDSIINNFYKSLRISDDEFFKNLSNLSKFMTDYYFSLLNKRVGDSSWIQFAGSAVVNAANLFSANRIQIYAGILGGNFFNSHWPKYLNYGGIGTIIGHEFIHGFDDIGKQFDKHGNLNNWWANETARKFRERADMVVQQYSNFVVADVNLTVNGINVQGEAISDIEGFNLAYKAYEKWERKHEKEDGLPAYKLISNMDPNVDPCTDFYQYACGGFLNKSSLLDMEKFTPRVDEISYLDNLERFRKVISQPWKESEPKYYKQYICLIKVIVTAKLEELGTAPLLESLNELEGWPVVLGSEWKENEFDWTKALIKFRSMGIELLFLEVYVTLNLESRHSATNLISIMWPWTPTLKEKYHKDFLDFMINLAVHLGADQARAEREMKAVLDFETTLSEISPPNQQNSSEPINVRVYELENYMPQISWYDFLNSLNFSTPITNYHEVTVGDANYLKKLSTLLSTTNKRIIANYMLWKVVKQHSLFLNKKFRNMLVDFNRDYLGYSVSPSRKLFCFRELVELMPVASSAIFVKFVLDPQSKPMATDIANNVRDVLTRSIQNIKWMDSGTLKSAMGKLKTMSLLIGYPEELLNDTLINDFYTQLSISNETFYKNILHAKKFEVDFQLSTLTKKTAEKLYSFALDARIMSTQYHYSLNRIALFAGQLTSPFFNVQWPKYLNYGGIGSVFGSAAIQGFDSLGKLYDRHGVSYNWWSDDTESKFQEKIDSAYQQYSNLENLEGNYDPERLQFEFFRVIEGTNLAYEAYKKWEQSNKEEPGLPGLALNSRQLFWLQGANMYCSRPTSDSDKYLITGHVINSKHFGKDYSKTKFLMLLLMTINQTSILIVTCENVCNTEDCLTTAATLLQNMNPDTNPCEDFYEYVCGNFQNTEILSYEMPFKSVLSKRYAEYLEEIKETRKALSDSDSVRKAKDFYNVCINSTFEDEIQDIKVYVEESLGSLPLIMKDEWDAEHFNWQAMLTYLTKNGFKNTGIFDIRIEATISDSVIIPIFYIEYQPSALNILLGNYSMIFDEANIKLNEILPTLFTTFAIPVTDDENFSNQISQIIKFIHLYVKLPTYSRPITRHTIEELQIYIPEFNWIKMFQKIVNSYLELETEVYVEGIDWLKSVIKAVHNTPKRTIANYLVLNTIISLYVNQELSLSFQSRIRDNIYNITDTPLLYEPLTPRSDFCVQHSGQISNAVKAMHFKKYFSEEIKNSVKLIVKHIHKTFFTFLYASYANEKFLNDIERVLENRNNSSDIPLEIAVDEKYLNDLYLDMKYEKYNLCGPDTVGAQNSVRSGQVSGQHRYFSMAGDWLGSAIVSGLDRCPVGTVSGPHRKSGLQQPDVKYIGSLKLGLQKIGSLLNGIVYAVGRNSAFNFGTLGFKITEGLIMFLRPFTELYHYQRYPLHSADPISETPDYMFKMYSNYVKKLPEFQQWPKWKEQDLYETVLIESIAVKLAYDAYEDWQLKHSDDSQFPGIELNSTQLFWLGYTTLHCVAHEENYTKFLPFYTPNENKISVLSMFYLIPDFNQIFDCQNE